MSEDKIETYEAIVSCNNCGKTLSIDVKFGVRLKEHVRLKSELCCNCNFRIDSNSLQHKGL